MNLKFISPVLFVKDIEISRRFYEGIFNFTVSEDNGLNIGYKEGVALWQMDHVYENIYRNLPGSQPEENTGHVFELYFETEEIEELFSGILKSDVNIMHGIVEQPWKQRVFRVYDPDGNIIEIGESMAIVMEREAKGKI